MTSAIIRYKYQLVNHRHNRHLHQMVDISGIVWNHAIALQRMYYRLTGKYIRPNDLVKHLRKLRRTRKQFWQAIPSATIVAIVRRLDIAYQRFFKGKARRPRFRKVKMFKSFQLTRPNWRLIEHHKNGYMRVKVFGRVYTFHYSRELLPLATQMLTVKRTPDGKFWLSFSVKHDLPVKVKSNRIAGFDFGLSTYLVGDNANTWESPRFFEQGYKALRKRSQKLSRKVKGSRNWQSARLTLARHYAKLANKRDDYQWKLAHELCDSYDVLCFEDLNIEGMKRLWGRKISDLSHSSFLRKLEWVAAKRGKAVQYIGRFEPTTKVCSGCGQSRDMLLSERIFECRQCGLVMDRDHNAAVNIKQAGERLLQESSKAQLVAHGC